MSSGKEFLQRISAPERSVENQLNAHRLSQVKENRRKLVPIINSIIFLCRKNISLRGHRDDGALLKEGEINFSFFANEGNFRELLRFRIESGDKELTEPLTRSSRLETYISKTIQNERISCCGTEISSIIKKELKLRFYTASCLMRLRISPTNRI